MSSDLHSPNRYVVKDITQEAKDRSSKRMVSDVRSRVRRITAIPQPPFSTAWFDFGELIESLACLVTTEEQEGASTSALVNVLEALLGAPAAPDGAKHVLGTSGKSTTVWERDDICLRLIVEEGKTQLVIRNLVLFYEGAERDLDSSIPLKLMELSLGILARGIFPLLETIMTMDHRAMIDHCDAVLSKFICEAAANPPPSTAAGAAILLRQRGAVVTYLAHLALNLEKVRAEDIIFERLMDRGVVPKVVKHLEMFLPLFLLPNYHEICSTLATDAALGGQGAQLPRLYPYIVQHDFPGNYIIFFSALCGAEQFKTHLPKFFPSRTEKLNFVNVVEPLLTHLASIDVPPTEWKKAVRPLTDTILRFK
jgi:hypothetical protein